jgi:hypothetical protein
LFCSSQWDAVESKFGGFNDQDSASGPGQWRGLEIGNYEEEAASSTGSKATCQIEETRISTGKELKVTIHHQQ